MSDNDDPRHAESESSEQVEQVEPAHVESAEPVSAPPAQEVPPAPDVPTVAMATQPVEQAVPVADAPQTVEEAPAEALTTVVPRQAGPAAEAPTQVVPPQGAAPEAEAAPAFASPAPAAPEALTRQANPQQVPQQAAPVYPGGQYPSQDPTTSGQYPAYQGQPQYQAPYPQQPYQQPYQQQPPRPVAPPPVNGYDVVVSLFDAGRALVAGLVSVFVALLVVVYAGVPNPHVSVGQFYKIGVWLLGSSLGTPIVGNGSVSGDVSGDGGAGGDGMTMNSSVDITLRVTVWALTFVVLFILYVLARRRERQLPSRSLGQLFLRSLLTAVSVSVLLLILALSAQWNNVFSDPAFGSVSGMGDATGSAGLGKGYLFLGPLLLALAAGLLARFGAWLHAPTTSDPRAERAKAAINLWRPAVRVARQQMTVMGTLIAVGLWIWVAVEAFDDPTTGSYRTALLLGALVLLPNLAVYGTFIGMGVTVFAGGGYGAQMLGQSSGDSVDGSPTSTSSALGIFQGQHPWGIWLLLLAVIVGTLAPAVLARTTRRFAVNRDEYTFNGAWRSIVVALVTTLAVILLGALSMNISGSAGGFGTMNVTVSLGPSTLGALGLASLWFLLAYVLLSLSLGHRLQPVGPRRPSPVPPQGTPEYAQYVQYQQYLAQQQQYQQYQQQFAQAPLPPQPEPTQPQPVQPPTQPLERSGQTVTVPVDAPVPPVQPTEPIATEQAATQVPRNPAQQYAQQYPQQYAQPYPGQQQYPPQWATPGVPGQSGPWPVQPMPGQPGRRKGLRNRIVIPVVLVILAGGGFLAYHFIAGDSGGGAAGAVTAYFNDLAAGDAKDAAALTEGPYPVTVINAAATLADAANRPSNFAVVSSRPPTDKERTEMAVEKFVGTNPTVLAVKYTVQGKQLTDTFLAVQNAGKWVLPSPYLYVQVSGGWSDKATVDGVAFTASDGVDVFPGAHVIAEPTNQDFSPESMTIVPQDVTSDGDTWAAYGDGNNITLPDPTLSSAGQEAVQQAYSSALDDCATQAETGQGDCGLDNYYDYYQCNNVTWSITAVGDVSVDLSSDSDGSFDWSSDGTVASETGDYTDYDGTDQTFSDQSTDLQNDGTVTFDPDGSATVTISD